MMKKNTIKMIVGFPVLTAVLLGMAGCDGGRTMSSDASHPQPTVAEEINLKEVSLTIDGVSQEFSCVALSSEELTYSVVAGISRTVVTSVLELAGQEDGVSLILSLPLSVEENGVPVFIWKEGQMLGFGPVVDGTYFSTAEVLSIDIRYGTGLIYSSWHGGAEGFVEAVRLGRAEGEPIELNFKNVVLFDSGKTDSLVLSGSLYDVIGPKVETGE